jgi:hypothetical protein
MQTIFPLVVFGAIGLFIVVGLLSMLTRKNLHDQIGQGGLFVGEDYSAGTGAFPEPVGSDESGAPSALESPAERELEIRQMLKARSDRLVRQGHEALDIDAELARLEWIPAHPTHPDPRADGSSNGAEGSGDPALAAEVRQLVLARNERRARQGLDALDVEAEVRRTLAELSP